LLLLSLVVVARYTLRNVTGVITGNWFLLLLLGAEHHEEQGSTVLCYTLFSIAVAI
jgi:hypothetical protein